MCVTECIGESCPLFDRCPANCQACRISDSTSFCVQCSGGRFLYNGRCYASCEGLDAEPQGEGALGRFCKANDPSDVVAPPDVQYEAAPLTLTSDRCVVVGEKEGGGWELGGLRSRHASSMCARF